MTISAPVSIGHAEAAVTATSVQITPGAAVGGGADRLIAVLVVNNVAGAMTCADDAGNTYSSFAQKNISGIYQQVFYCLNPTALSTSQKITITGGGGSTAGRLAAMACYIDGIVSTPADIQGNGVSGTALSASIATGTLSQADEIIFGWVRVLGATGSDLFTEAAGFTTLPGSYSASNYYIHLGYKIVSSTDSVTYAPQFSTGASASRTFNANVYSFKGSAGAAAPGGSPTLLLMGV